MLGIGVVLVALAAWSTFLLAPRAGDLLGLKDTGRFFDLRGSLAAGEAARQGLDPFALNPLDPYGRPHLYSSWWLVTGTLGLVRADAAWLGPLLLASVLATALFLWPLRRTHEALLACAVLVSPAWLLAVNRANNDLVIFILLAAAIGGYRSTVPAFRLAAAALTGLLAILKYFPIAALAGILGATRRKEALGLFAVAALVIALGLPSLDRVAEVVARHGPVVTGLQGFGATLIVGIISPGVPGLAGLLAGVVVALVGYQLARTDANPAGNDGALNPIGAAVAGAAMVTCFFLGSSFNYKLIFFWCWWPWLLDRIAHDPGRRRFQVLLALLVWVHWSDGLTIGVMNWFGPEWSVAQRIRAMSAARVLGLVTQVAYWLLIGAALRVATEWGRQRWAVLSTRP